MIMEQYLGGLQPGEFWNLMGFVVAIFTGLIALMFSVYTFKHVMKGSSYADLDKMYMDVLKIGMDNPDFRNLEKTSTYTRSFTDNQLIKYDTYAYMVWNTCETVYDTTANDKDNRHTWEPIIHAELQLHKAWMKNKNNHHKFKKEFVDYVLAKKLSTTLD